MTRAVTYDSLVEVTLRHPEDFLKIKETLTRIGVASSYKKALFQSCHILHRAGRYYITHFKERYALDGFPTNITEDDVARRNSIAAMLAKWGLCDLVDPEVVKSPQAPSGSIKVLKHAEKDDWSLVPKYARWPT